MNQEDLIKKLENLNLPEVKTAGHQNKLRQTLLNSKKFNESEKTQFKHGWAVLFSRKTIFSMSTLMIAFIVVGSILGLTPQNSPDVAQAEAMDIVRGALQKVRLLSPEKRIELEATLGKDLNEILAEASKAKDLRWIGTGDMEVKFPDVKIERDLPILGMPTNFPRQMHGYEMVKLEERLASEGKTLEEFHATMTANLSDDQLKELQELRQTIKEDVRLLQFTNEEGKIIQLGVDGQSMPVLHLIDKNGQVNFTNPAPPSRFRKMKLFGPTSDQTHDKVWVERLNN